MKRLLILLLFFNSLYLFSQSNNQSQLDNWKFYKLGNSDLEIKFPGEPRFNIMDTVNIIEQYNYRFGTENIIDSNFMYFISVVKYNKVINVDSITFVNANSMMINSKLQNSYDYKIISQEDIKFKNYAAKSTKAELLLTKTQKCIFNSITIRYKNYILSMFVLTDPKFDNNKNIEFYFNSLTI